MPYDVKLAERVRKELRSVDRVTEIKMFGGLCFTIAGNMCCGVLNDDLVIRLDHETAAQALGEPHVRPMDFTGRPSRGVVYVAPGGYRTPAGLRRWVKRSVAFASSLPPKK
jgi:TfoX/Sxy family transcriptional regulator of competence genes